MVSPAETTQMQRQTVLPAGHLAGQTAVVTEPLTTTVMGLLMRGPMATTTATAPSTMTAMGWQMETATVMGLLMGWLMATTTAMGLLMGWPMVTATGLPKVRPMVDGTRPCSAYHSRCPTGTSTGPRSALRWFRVCWC